MGLLDRQDTPNLGESIDQFNRRTGRGFFMQVRGFEDIPVTQSWEGDIIYWENEVRKAQRMKDAAVLKHNEKVRKNLNTI